jgi:hypothetical protein
VNIDIPSAVSTALGALPEIRALRAEIVEASPGYDIARFDLLEEAAFALNEAHGDYLIAIQPSDELRELLTEAVTLRERLLGDANVLALRGLIDAESFSELKGPVGHKNLASDLNVLHKTLRASWSKIVGKSATTVDELQRAARLQMRIIRLLGEKDQSTPSAAAVTEARSRAFTLFLRIYDHVRRGVAFVRWEGKGFESIAPNLYAGRGSKRRPSDPTQIDGELSATGTPVAGTPAAGTPATGVTPPVAGAVATATTAAAKAAAAPAGLHSPEEDPFL